MLRELYSKILIKSFLVLFFIFSFATPAQAGFGVSPPYVYSEILARGSHFESIVNLVQGNPETDLQLNVVVSIDKIKDWIKIEGGNTQIIPAGVQQFPLKVIVDVPDNAEYNRYKGYISIATEPVVKKTDEGGQNTITMNMGARVELDLTVGDNIIQDFEVRTIKILNIKEGDPLKTILTIVNIGNTKIKPERVTFDLFDKYANVRLAFVEADLSKTKEVDAFKTEDIDIKFPIDLKLGLGEYWGEVKVYKNGQVLKINKTVFNVLKKTFWEKNYLYFYAGGAGLLAIIILIAILKIKRGKKSGV